MLAVPLSERELLPLLESGLDLAAVNAPSQCVVSGPSERIDAFSRKLAQQDIECRKLAVSHAFHSAMMEPAAQAVAEAAGKVTLHAPQLHYFSSVTGKAIEEEVTDAAYWGRNVRQTVRFSSALQALAGNPDQIFLEVGPGRALVGLVRKSLQGATHSATIASLDGNNTGRRALLNVLGQLWKEGADVDWRRMHGDTPLRRVALPTYPFKRERHWLADVLPKEGGAKRGARSGSRLPPQQWFYVPSWKTTLAPRPFANEEIEREEDCWLIFTGSEDTGEAVLRKLQTAQAKIVTVVPADEYAQIDPYRYALNPGEGEHYRYLLRDLQANGIRPSRVIHCWSQEVLRDAPSLALFRTTQKRGYLSILYLIQACAKYIDDVSLTLVVVGNQLHCIGSEDKARPEKASISALAKIVRQEFPGIGCMVLDLPIAANALDECYADWIIAEALRPPSDVAIAYRGKRRMLQVFEQVEFDTASMPVRALRNKGVYLITGGMGMIGLGLADCLASACKARLILVNRTGFPEKSAWDSWLSEHDASDKTSRKIRKIQAIEAMGAEVMIAAADVADEEQLRAVLADAQDRFGTVNGIFHLAADMTHSSMRRLVENISPDDFEAQILPKAGGFYALDKAFNGQQLDFGVLFSSNSAVVGGTGFGAYAPANAFFDGVAAADGHGSDIPWITTNWDGWHSSSPSAGNTPHSQDATVLGMEEGLQALLNILAFSTAPQVIISATDLESRIDTWVRQSRTIRSKSEAQKSQAAQLTGQSKKIMPRTNLERVVTAIWEEVLGIEGIGVEDNFLDLGGDSLIALRVLIRIRDKFGVDVPLSRFIAAKLNIAGLAVEVVSQLAQQREKQIVNKTSERIDDASPEGRLITP